MTFLHSCIAQELNCGNGPCHLQHALAKYREYNEKLLLFCDYSFSNSVHAASAFTEKAMLCITCCSRIALADFISSIWPEASFAVRVATRN